MMKTIKEKNVHKHVLFFFIKKISTLLLTVLIQSANITLIRNVLQHIEHKEGFI